MEKTPRPTIAGILNIISGSFGLLVSFSLFLLVFVSNVDFEYYPGVFPEVISAAAVFAAIISLLVSLLILVSGIYALERRYWGLSLAGSIAAAMGCLLLGIPALVLIAISKDEFDGARAPENTDN